MAYDVTFVQRAKVVEDQAVSVVKRMRVDRTVSTDEVERLAGSVRDLAIIVQELARRVRA